ncbi:imm11 family protein [Pasteurella sp. PK-2025]|uniref:imm11 family protein n=1 Tax=Pasteurella sp. PK-2025 TaxID=3413133 RepID=UPI003C767C58
MIIYELKRNYEYSGGFSLKLPPEKAVSKFSILSLSCAYKGKILPDNIISDEFKVFPNDYGRKNFKFDFHIEGNIFILSKKLYERLSPILSDCGHCFKIITDSKKKEYIGYHLTKVIDCLDLKSSEYKRYENGIIIYKPVLCENKISEKYIFQIKEDLFRVFVTEEFKKILDDNKVLDFDFNENAIVDLAPDAARL